MVKLTKFSLLLTAVFFAVFVLSNNVSAHSGNTDASGCHTCRTNCTSYGLYYGEYHCHNPKPYVPSYTPSIPITPSCPISSSYDSISGKCKCYYGYVADTDYSGKLKCVSGDSKCREIYGYGSKYNSISNKCECNYGYIMSGSKCISESDYCSDILGFNSKYNSLYEKCECNYGYKLYGNECITEDDYCEEILGSNSKYSLGGKCECDFNYVFNGSSCVIEEDEEIESYQELSDLKNKKRELIKSQLNIINNESNDTATIEQNKAEIVKIEKQEAEVLEKNKDEPETDNQKIEYNDEKPSIAKRFINFFKKIIFW
jgi:hypothetical protein